MEGDCRSARSIAAGRDRGGGAVSRSVQGVGLGTGVMLPRLLDVDVPVVLVSGLYVQIIDVESVHHRLIMLVVRVFR